MCDREEFEKKFSVPEGVEWIDERQGYRITSDDDYWFESEGQAHFRGFIGQWIGWRAARAQDRESEKNWIWPTKQNPEPKHDGNWLTYRPDAPADSQVATIWYDSKHNGWSGKYRVAAWMSRPNPPAEGEE